MGIISASPQLSIINNFGSNRRLELEPGYINIGGRAADGVLAGTSLRVGRQSSASGGARSASQILH